MSKGGRGSRAGELAPLAVLASVLVTAALVRTGTPRAPVAAPPHAIAATGDAALPPADAPLRGARADGARVEEAGPRTLHGDARRTHRSHGRGPRAVKLAWTADVGAPVEAQVTASPDAQTLYVASLGGALTALARGTGAVRWRVPLGDRAYGAPAVAPDGTIYAGSDAKAMRAIGPRGDVLWTLEVPGEADTAPLLTDDGMIVFAAGSTVLAARRGGDVAWRFVAKGKVFTSPALAPGGLVVFGAQDHRVYAVRAATGEQAWSVDLGADVDGGPAIGDHGEIFVGTDGEEIVRLDAAGAVAWRTHVGGFVRGALSVARSGDVLAGVYGPSPRQVRLDGATGAVRGARAVPGTGAREFGVHGGALEDDEGTLYFGAQDDRVYGVDEDGRTSFIFQTAGDVDAPITMLDGGAIVVASDDGKVYLLLP